MDTLSDGGVMQHGDIPLFDVSILQPGDMIILESAGFYVRRGEKWISGLEEFEYQITGLVVVVNPDRFACVFGALWQELGWRERPLWLPIVGSENKNEDHVYFTDFSVKIIKGEELIRPVLFGGKGRHYDCEHV